MRQLNPFYKNKEWCYFLTGSFLVTNSLNIDVASKKRLCSTVDLVVSVVRIVLFNIYKIYKRFYIFQGSYNILNFYVYHCQRHIQNLLKHLRWSFLLKAVNNAQPFILDIWFLIIRLRLLSLTVIYIIVRKSL